MKDEDTLNSKSQTELPSGLEKTDRGDKGSQEAKKAQPIPNHTAQNVKCNVVTIGSHNASPEATRRKHEAHDWEDLDGQISRLIKVYRKSSTFMR